VPATVLDVRAKSRWKFFEPYVFSPLSTTKVIAKVNSATQSTITVGEHLDSVLTAALLKRKQESSLQLIAARNRTINFY
jgi:hypothetical protein